MEIENWGNEMSVALFNKNSVPVGTRYLTLADHSLFLPTIALCSNGSDVDINISWQTMTLTPPVFGIVSLLAYLGSQNK